MGFKKALATGILRITRWDLLVEQQPPLTGSIMLGFPHTTTMDAVYMLCIAWSVDLDVKWLVKKSMTRPPLGWIVKPLGAVPVDREHPQGFVQGIVEGIERRNQKGIGKHPWSLVIAPEGTRSKTEYWKSGFYRIATETGLPVMLGFVDSRNRTLGLGPVLEMTGDPREDMDKIREFYAGRVGIKPGKQTTPRLRMEDEGYVDHGQKKTG